MGLLARSHKEEATALWTLVEHANSIGIPHQECGDEDVPGGVTLRTVHTTKGKQYTHVFLFLVQSGLWLTRSGRLQAKEENLLYVALTRAVETLVVVECKSSSERLFKKLWDNARDAHVNAAKPAPPFEPLCAHSGLPADYSVACNPMKLSGRSAKRSLVETVLKAAPVRSKVYVMEKLQSRLRAGECVVDGAAALEKVDPPVTSLEAVVVDAVLEYRLTRDVSALSALLRWCERRKESGDTMHPRRAYVRVSDRTSGHCFLERFEKELTSLPLDVDAWGVAHWSVLCSFHPKFHYGHLLPAVRELRADLVVAMIERCLRDRSHDLKLMRPISASGIDVKYARLLNFCITSEGHFIESENRGVFLYLSVGVESPRACDLYAAAFAAHILELECVTLVYLDSDRRVNVLPEPATWDLAVQMLKLIPEDGAEL